MGKALTGKQFYQMLLNGANALFIKKERLNKLNVFPVPDGDTGINMYSTLEPILHFETKDYSLHHVANELSMEMLKASRGNSGTILATFFLGMASRFNNLETASIEEIIQAFKAGKEYSY
ncbi:MAG: DAK2 domain-containing protein, partial [Bacilli bacterium]